MNAKGCLWRVKSMSLTVGAKPLANFEISFLDDYSDQSLLEEIRRVAALENGRPTLSSDTFEKASRKVSISTIRRRFGSWQNALTRAGVAHLYSGRKVSDKMREQPAKRLSQDDLIADMRRVHTLIGKGFLTVSDFNSHSVTSVEAVRRRFGTWANALKKAGISQSELANKNWTDEHCFENLATVWSHHGRSPGYRDLFSAPSIISGKAYETRWGTWRQALRAFVAWANSEGPLAAPDSPPRIDTPQAAAASKPERRPEENQRQVGARLRFQLFRRDRFRCVACGTLGHASIQTTEKYLGVQQDLTDAPCDHLGIKAR